MKALVRSYIWRPKMDSGIEEIVKLCPICHESRTSPPTTPLHPWEWPSKPLSRLLMDFVGLFLGHICLVLGDAHSKWMDVQLISFKTSSKTIDNLWMTFSTDRLPHKIVTDKGTTLQASYFVSSCKVMVLNT